jgi:hypothetical protein
MGLLFNDGAHACPSATTVEDDAKPLPGDGAPLW